MRRCLVTYATNAGSTAEVAGVIARVMGETGAAVDLRRVEEAGDPAGYDLVVVGAPMILGWHRSALRFLKRHREALAGVQVACFATLMSLTLEQQPGDVDYPVQVDPWLAKPPKNARRLSLKERYATLGNYLRPLRKAAPGLAPLQFGFFGGKLELFSLKWWQALFVMVVIQAQPGDLRNWDFIEDWARKLREAAGG